MSDEGHPKRDRSLPWLAIAPLAIGVLGVVCVGIPAWVYARFAPEALPPTDRGSTNPSDKIDAFLPTDRGLTKSTVEITPHLRLHLTRATPDAEIGVRLGDQTFDHARGDEMWREVSGAMRARLDTLLESGVNRDAVRGVVEASLHVPTTEVVRAVDAFISAGVANVTFVGTPPPGSTLDKLQQRLSR